jgi:hypothetical protein
MLKEDEHTRRAVRLAAGLSSLDLSILELIRVISAQDVTAGDTPSPDPALLAWLGFDWDARAVLQQAVRDEAGLLERILSHGA